MSLRAILWALDEAPVECGMERLVLVYLADYASDDGTGVFPAYSTVAQRAGTSRSTIKRHVQALAERGILLPGDENLVRHYRADKRPNVWNLNYSMSVRLTGGQNDPSLSSGGSNLSERGVKTTERGVTADPQTVNIKPGIKPGVISRADHSCPPDGEALTPAESTRSINANRPKPLAITEYPGSIASRPCPKCGAAAGEQCHRPDGTAAAAPCAPRWRPHPTKDTTNE